MHRAPTACSHLLRSVRNDGLNLSTAPWPCSSHSYKALTQPRCGLLPKQYPTLKPRSQLSSFLSTSSPKMPPSTTALSDIEDAKRNAARAAVAEHFDPAARYVGIGSGSTIVYVVEAIQALNDPRIANINFIPTGYQSRQANLPPLPPLFPASPQA